MSNTRYWLYIYTVGQQIAADLILLVPQLTQSAFLEDISLFNALRENVISVEKVIKCKSLDIKDRISKTY